MIPDISIMVGLYIITKMLTLLFDKAQTSVVPRIFAWLTIAGVLAVVADIWSKGSTVSQALSQQ